ncbi:S9 family peptidase [Ferroacidibacillus organovorans]|uniref:Peptidase S9 prolyl oligopeptidase catalytic domain-containing protein n=1 Tax=Ferroacidibacillus organovorans TaxID=1765683 RepID=A0A853K8C0_9BACL|nr:prolyl oligopeptidase family serine peptidase [Ferroacidibacillus organovorans]KYP80794.1 hypothetical protein AYJ22_09630 [Ferroacidibacillus organovorans]OAG93205.1 hypothetical protein AYW79_11925 [Ferroacidibacillus organovorans]
MELYVMDLHTRHARRVTDGQAPKHLMAGFVWTRDDQAIVFAKDTDGDEQHNLYRLHLLDGSVIQLNDDPKSQDYPGTVAQDNRSMLVNSNRNGQMNVFRFSFEDRGWTQLTHSSTPAGGATWSSDGQQIVYMTNLSSNLRNQDLYIMDAHGGPSELLWHLRDGSRESIADWHTDGYRLAVSSDETGVNRPAVLNIETRDVQWFGPGTADEYAAAFSKNGRWLLTMRSEESAIFPILYDLETGETKTPRLPEGISYNVNFVLEDTKLLISQSASNRRTQILLYDIATDSFEVLCPAAYGDMDPDWFVADQHVFYPSSDGVSVPALLCVPQDIEPGALLPAILYIHGGPTGQFYRNFDAQVQTLVDQGYVVLMPNIRGSTGYGVAWRDACLQDWGGKDLDDVVAGATYLKSLGYVDPQRIGIYGISYGGYMSYIAAVKAPDVFAVSAPFVGISDIEQLYAESMEHFKYYLRQQMGDPDTHRDLWRDRSAVTHVDALRAKMLIVHGVNDPRCPISQARGFRERMLARDLQEGLDFAYYEFEEGHGAFGDSEGEIRNFKLLLNFLERHL